jgi:hypothetical protein
MKFSEMNQKTSAEELMSTALHRKMEYNLSLKMRNLSEDSSEDLKETE